MPRVLVHFDTPAPPKGLKFVVARYVVDAVGAVPESLQDEHNQRLRPISDYAGDVQLQRVARSVAKLRFVGPQFSDTCTGFMVTDSILVTNQHCVPNNEVCRSLHAIFNWDPGVNENDTSDPRVHHCVRLVQPPDITWDFALVQLDGAPGDVTRWGHLTLQERSFSPNHPLVIVQYPDLVSLKQVARDGCFTKTAWATSVDPQVQSDFGHVCDTKGGSSGSPVLDTDGVVVGLHHWGFDTLDPRWIAENRAIHVSKIAGILGSMGPHSGR